MGDLIWAAALFVPLIILVLGLLGPLRRALSQWGDAHAKSAAERDAGVQTALADVAERRHKLAISQALLSEETGSERARLAAETAQYDTEREAAGNVLADAEAALRKVIAARAEAQAELAPEIARAGLKDSSAEMGALANAYAAYCQDCPSSVVPHGFGDWLGDFEGLGG